jgi:hypothetical protein
MPRRDDSMDSVISIYRFAIGWGGWWRKETATRLVSTLYGSSEHRSWAREEERLTLLERDIRL